MAENEDKKVESPGQPILESSISSSKDGNPQNWKKNPLKSRA